MGDTALYEHLRTRRGSTSPRAASSRSSGHCRDYKSFWGAETRAGSCRTSCQASGTRAPSGLPPIVDPSHAVSAFTKIYENNFKRFDGGPRRRQRHDRQWLGRRDEQPDAECWSARPGAWVAGMIQGGAAAQAGEIGASLVDTIWKTDGSVVPHAGGIGGNGQHPRASTCAPPRCGRRSTPTILHGRPRYLLAITHCPWLAAALNERRRSRPEPGRLRVHLGSSTNGLLPATSRSGLPPRTRLFAPAASPLLSAGHVRRSAPPICAFAVLAVLALSLACKFKGARALNACVEDARARRALEPGGKAAGAVRGGVRRAPAGETTEPRRDQPRSSTGRCDSLDLAGSEGRGAPRCGSRPRLGAGAGSARAASRSSPKAACRAARSSPSRSRRAPARSTAARSPSRTASPSAPSYLAVARVEPWSGKDDLKPRRGSSCGSTSLSTPPRSRGARPSRWEAEEDKVAVRVRRPDAEERDARRARPPRVAARQRGRDRRGRGPRTRREAPPAGEEQRFTYRTYGRSAPRPR